jgi:hypothetical protein
VSDQLTQPSLVIGRNPLLRRPTRRLPRHTREANRRGPPALAHVMSAACECVTWSPRLSLACPRHRR